MLPNLVYYVQFLTDAQRYSDGFFGYVLELAVKDFFNLPLLISPPEKKDLKATIYDNAKHYIEVKQNGGDFRSACHGSGMIAYAVYIDLDKPLNQQFGYVMPMSIFRTVGTELKHIRSEKKDKDGNLKMSLQSLYNYKENDFHGKKAFKLADSWEDKGAITFKDCFVKQSNIGNRGLNQLTANKSKQYFYWGFLIMLTANILYRESKAMQERVKVAEETFDTVYRDYNRDDTELTISDYRKAKDTLNACKEAVELLNKLEDVYQFLFPNQM